MTPRKEHRAFCGAKKRQGEGSCTRPAGWGTDHAGHGRCKLHGGSSPGGRLAAAKQEASARAVVMGAPVDVEPHEALVWCVRQAAGAAVYASQMVAVLEPEDAIGSPVSTTRRKTAAEGEQGDGLDGEVVETRHGTPELHVWIRAQRDAVAELARMSKMAIDAGVAERQVQLAERLGGQLAEMIRPLVADLAREWGIARPFERPQTRQVVQRHLVLLAGGAPEAGPGPLSGGRGA